MERKTLAIELVNEHLASLLASDFVTRLAESQSVIDFNGYEVELNLSSIEKTKLEHDIARIISDLMGHLQGE